MLALAPPPPSRGVLCTGLFSFLLLAGGCGGGGEATEGEDPERPEARVGAGEAAGLPSPPLSHGEILPGLPVQGPPFLPGLDTASAAEASLPWGLVPASGEEAAHFLDDLRHHCTAPSARVAYPGRTTLNTLANPAPFEGAVLRMVLDRCDEDLLPIPFVVGEDWSRTWLLSFEEGALRLAHDHRDAQGRPGEANLYGGVAHRGASGMGNGTPEHILYFPADPPTLEDRPARAANAWAMALDPGGERFHYRLYLNGVLRLEAAFDLTRHVPLPPPPSGDGGDGR